MKRLNYVIKRSFVPKEFKDIVAYASYHDRGKKKKQGYYITLKALNELNK